MKNATPHKFSVKIWSKHQAFKLFENTHLYGSSLDPVEHACDLTMGWDSGHQSKDLHAMLLLILRVIYVQKMFERRVGSFNCLLSDYLQTTGI